MRTYMSECTENASVAKNLDNFKYIAKGDLKTKETNLLHERKIIAYK